MRTVAVKREDDMKAAPAFVAGEGRSEPTRDAAKPMAAVARLSKPRGVKGQLWVERYRAGYPAFEPGEVYRLGGPAERDLQVERSFDHKGGCVVQFEGLASIEEAEKLAGAELLLPAEAVEPDPPGTFDAESVRGFAFVDARRGPSGTVLGVEERPAYWVIIVEGPAGRFEVPAVRGLSFEVDEASRAVAADLPSPWPGLDEASQ